MPNPTRKKLYCLPLLILLLLGNNLLGQTCSQLLTPSKCFEIISVVADACGTEQEGEMVLMKIGTAPANPGSGLNIVGMNVQWPLATASLSWRGWVQNTSTNAKIAAMNSQITTGNCAKFFQVPNSNNIPNGSMLLLISDTNFNPSSYDFSGLRDSVYVVFQNGGNTSEHLPNYSIGPSSSKVIVSFSAACADTVTYNKGILIRSNGSVGAENGSMIEYTFAGLPTYKNFGGCKGPLTDLFAEAGTGTEVCKTKAISLGGFASLHTCTRWSLGPGAFGFFSNPNLPNPQYTPSVNDSPTVWLFFRADSKCGFVKDSVSLPILELPFVDITTPPSDLCKPNTINLSGNGGPAYPPFTYQWFGGSGGFSSTTTPNTVYTAAVNESGQVNLKLQVVSICGTITDNVNIQIYDIPEAQIIIPKDTICAGDSIQLFGSVANGTISWISNGTGTFSSTVTANPWYRPGPGETGSVKFYLEDASICGIDWDTAEVLFVPVPDPTFSGLKPIYCLDDPAVNLVPNSAGGTFFGTRVSGSTFTPDSIGAVKVYYVINNLGCVRADTAISNVVPKPLAKFSYSPEKPKPAENINFTNEGTKGAGYLWTFGDPQNSQSNVENPVHSYINGGKYLVTQKVIAGGCEDTATAQIIIESEDTFSIVNVFTPNGDGMNDEFSVISKGVTDFSMEIFNRWGEKIFSSSDPGKGWDGTVGGSLSPEGTYFYFISAKTSSKDYDEKGFLTLFR